MTIKDFRYIYNVYQANFYINNNVEIVETGTANTGKVYYKFKDSLHLQQVYKLWLLKQIK